VKIRHWASSVEKRKVLGKYHTALYMKNTDYKNLIHLIFPKNKKGYYKFSNFKWRELTEAQFAYYRLTGDIS